MALDREKRMVMMDAGSAAVVRNIVEESVSCGESMDLEVDPHSTAAIFFPLLSPYGLFCKAMFANSEPYDDVSAQQCVAMGGDVERCPRFGMTPTGESRGEHEKLRKLVELQKEIAENLTYSSLGNFNTVSGSKLDKS